MRSAHHVFVRATSVCLFALATGPASAVTTGNGLVPDRGDPLSRWQARVTVNEGATRLPAWNEPGLKPRSIGLLGDYYISRSTWIPRTVGGFRATGAMFLGNQTTDAGPLSRFGLYTLTSGGSATAGLVATPYAGVGYSVTSLRQGWGFSADLGLLSARSGQAGRLARSGNLQGVDDLLREMRIEPLLQVGVSYSF